MTKAETTVICAFIRGVDFTNLILYPDGLMERMGVVTVRGQTNLFRTLMIAWCGNLTTPRPLGRATDQPRPGASSQLAAYSSIFFASVERSLRVAPSPLHVGVGVLHEVPQLCTSHLCPLTPTRTDGR